MNFLFSKNEGSRGHEMEEELFTHNSVVKYSYATLLRNRKIVARKFKMAPFSENLL